MSAPPYMKLYVADYLGDTHHLSALEHGAYLLLLMGMWRAGGRLPADDAKLSKVARCTPEQWAEIRGTILDFFRRRGGVLTHKRVAREMAKYETVSATRKEASAKAVAAKHQKNSTLASPNGSGDANHKVAKPEPEPEERIDADASLSPTGDLTKDQTYPEPFEAAWKAYPHVRGRSSKPKALGFWRRLPQAHREALPLAAARYAREGREPKADCGAPGMHLWIRDAKFADWTSESPGAAASPLSTWPGPADMRADFVARYGEPEARSYLDPCGWVNGPDRHVTSANNIRLDWLRRNAGDWLAAWQAKPLQEGRA